MKNGEGYGFAVIEMPTAIAEAVVARGHTIHGHQVDISIIQRNLAKSSTKTKTIIFPEGNYSQDDEQKLREYFLEFGQLDDFLLLKDFCCVIYSKPVSVERFLQKKDHKFGGNIMKIFTNELSSATVESLMHQLRNPICEDLEMK